MSSNRFLSSDAHIAVISISLVVVAIALWWAATLISALLLLAALLILVRWSCIKASQKIQPMAYRSARPRRIIYRRGNEDLGEFERRVRQAIFDELHEDEYESEPRSQLSLSDLDETIPVTIIGGVRKECAQKLRKHDIVDLEDLSETSGKELMRICAIDRKTALFWIADAQAVTYGAGITSILDLSLADPTAMLDEIMNAEKSGDIDFPNNYSIDIGRVQDWVNAANKETSSMDYEEVRRWLDRNGN